MNRYPLIACSCALVVILTAGCKSDHIKSDSGRLKPILISENNRYFMTADGKPFFWLGDTGWLLFSKLNREETKQYLENRHRKGFNIIQVMVLHSLSATDAYGDSALVDRNVATPKITKGDEFEKENQYDYWDNVDYVVDQAAERGIYVAMVPVWGTNVKAGLVSRNEAKAYASFLAKRYKDKPNIIWMNGGDIKGSDSTAIWNLIGKTLREKDPGHLITFHPFGRTQSSTWFQDTSWLDFNLFQSGHRRYDQDPTGYGEDSWKYVDDAYYKKPVKPVLDGEPSYENIPEGLHDTTQPRWKADAVRRYAYWSVFAGACGHTYGDNAVMQFHRPSDKSGAYGAKEYWNKAMDTPGAGQMIYLKKLMLSYPYFDRIPDSTLVVNQGKKYDHIAATRGKDYALFYTYNGRDIVVNMGKIEGKKVEAGWFCPRNGKLRTIGSFKNEGTNEFDPPGKPMEGNDWVLVLKSYTAKGI